MSTVINFRGVRYFSETINGSDFSLDTTNRSNQLLGGVMEKIKFRCLVDIAWFVSSESYIVSSGGNIIQITDGSFVDNGFTIGDRIILTQNSNAANNPIAVITDFVGEGTIIVAYEGGTGPPLGDGIYTDTLLVRGITPQLGLIWSFGLIENSEVFNTFSKLDNSNNQYYFEQVGEVNNFLNPYSPSRNTDFSDGIWNDVIKGSQTGISRARFDSYQQDTYIGFLNFFTIQTFEIEHEFIIYPYWREGEDTNLELVQPPNDLFAGNKSLKYALQTEWRNVYSNPNTSKTQRFDNDNGSVGYFNEVFNGFQKSFQVDSITYINLDTFLEIDSVNVNAPTLVQADCSVLNGTDINVDQLTGVALHSRAPFEEDYSEQQEAYQDVWLYDSVRTTQGIAPGPDSDIIKDFSIFVLSPTEFRLEFRLEFTADDRQRLDFEQDEKYILGCSLVNTNKDNVNISNKQTLLLDFNSYIQESDIPGLITGQDLTIYPHQINVGDTGFKNYAGWIEDGFLAEFNFDVELDLDAVIDSITAQYVAYNPTTEDSFVIQSVPVNITNQAIGSNGEQVITLDTTRGFKLADGDQFNFVKVETGTYDAVDNKQPYTVQVGFKANWQQWLELGGVPDVFTDNSEPFLGRNQLSSRYSNSEGYFVRVWFTMNVSQDGVVTEYIHSSDNFDIRFYEDDNGERYSAVINTFKSDGVTSLNGAIISNEDTIIEVRFTPIGHATTASEVYGIIRIEEQLQGGFNIDECSSIRDIALGNRVIPLEGQTNAEVFDDAGDIVVRCRTDFNQLSANAEYKLSGKIGTLSPAELGAFDEGFDDGFE